MNRFFHPMMLTLAGLVCFWLYQVKEEARSVKHEISSINTQIAKEKISINMLKAEWSYLNQPSRLQGLIERHQVALGIGPIDLKQIITLDKLPAPVVVANPLDQSALDALAIGNVQSEVPGNE